MPEGGTVTEKPGMAGRTQAKARRRQQLRTMSLQKQCAIISVVTGGVTGAIVYILMGWLFP